jgi:hypothetical protein
VKGAYSNTTTTGKNKTNEQTKTNDVTIGREWGCEWCSRGKTYRNHTHTIIDKYVYVCVPVKGSESGPSEKRSKGEERRDGHHLKHKKKRRTAPEERRKKGGRPVLGICSRCQSVVQQTNFYAQTKRLLAWTRSRGLPCEATALGVLT